MNKKIAKIYYLNQKYNVTNFHPNKVIIYSYICVYFYYFHHFINMYYYSHHLINMYYYRIYIYQDKKYNYVVIIHYNISLI